MQKDSTVAYHILVKGRVQGVGFRYSTRQAAGRFGVKGWVRNTPDGSVEVVCEGPRDKVEKLLKWLHSGPPGSYVAGIETTHLKPQGVFRSFTVEF